MQELNHEAILAVLTNQSTQTRDELLHQADLCRHENIGSEVYLRGLIEFSNYCDRNCFYCGLRKNNLQINRYRLTREQVVDTARQAYEQNFYSLALQSGEVEGPDDFNYILDVVKAIKEFGGQRESRSLGITLSIGELTYQQYRQLWEAGAHRYLLRIESSDPALFKKIHPPDQLYDRRLECLAALKDIGFQVGTGIMIGLPGQTYEHLTRDLNFFMERDIDMLGMGPYIPHPNTPLARIPKGSIQDPYSTTLKMMALARLLMRDINMVVSTALQTIHPDGLSMGLKAGANIVMPVLTPEENRTHYSLYANKAFINFDRLRQEIERSGYQLGQSKWGDSRHYYRRLNLPYPETG